MALLILPQRYLSQPQQHVEIAPEYADAEVLALFNTTEWRDLKGRHSFSSTVPPNAVIRPHGRSQNYGYALGTFIRTVAAVPAHPVFTIFAWVRPTALNGGYKRIFETTYSVGFFLGSSNAGSKYNFIVRGSALDACIGGQQVIGQRDFVAGVYDGTNRILYVNGREVARATASSPTFSGSLFVGADAGNTNLANWAGDIDTVGLFPKAFSAEQILSLYNDPYQLVRPTPRRIWFTPTEPGSEHNLSINNADQANTASTGSVTQDHALTPASAAQNNTASAGALVQVHSLAIANATQANLVDDVEIGVGAVAELDIANAAQTNTAGAGGVTQEHLLSGENSTQQNAASTPAISQTHTLTVPNLTQPNTASDGEITGDTVVNLTISASVQPNTAEADGISQTHVLVITASAQENSASTVSVTQIHALTPASATQNNLASDGAVVSYGDLAVADLLQSNTLSGGNVTTIQTLTITSAEQDNRVSSGALIADVVFEAAMAATTAVIQSRIKKPGIPHDTEQWLRTMLEIIVGRRGNKIEVPQQQNLTFSGTPTKAEAEALYAYTNEVRSAIEQLINRLDS